MQIYQVDAFASRMFEGNPAAVVPLDNWLDDDLMQRIAQENNLAETAFFIPQAQKNTYHLRWFTPTHEVKLCGHATLASAHVLFNELHVKGSTLRFDTLSGPLLVSQQSGLYTMDFPSQAPLPCSFTDALKQGLGDVAPLACLQSEDYIVVLENEEAVRSVKPDFVALMQAQLRGVIVTARCHTQYDFVARFFGPKVGVPEDSVTGSAYTQLTPYWAKQLNKDTMTARQVAARGGDLKLRLEAERVYIGGSAVTYMRGELNL
jgi:PhzF family phenazine biosynthesis protein